MRVENNSVILTNNEYFAAYCTERDYCRINRMWLRHLDRTITRDAPMWLKEEEYDKWLHLKFDKDEWDFCELKKDIYVNSFHTIKRRVVKRIE